MRSTGLKIGLLRDRAVVKTTARSDWACVSLAIVLLAGLARLGLDHGLGPIEARSLSASEIRQGRMIGLRAIVASGPRAWTFARLIFPHTLNSDEN